MSDADLTGKTVLVTGAGQGLGRAYALDAAAAGAHVVVNDLSPDAAQLVVSNIESAGGAALAAPGSVTDPEIVAGLIAECVRVFGRIDGLVNNAGVLVERHAWETTADQARTMVEVNVLGTIYCGQAALAQMREQGGTASIVNVTSGTHLGQPGLAVYGATKGAVASLTYGWALELAGTGVRVNAISPLAVTPMKLPPHDGHAQPEDIAAVVRYLLSDASAFVTGQIVRRARTELGIVRHPSIGTMLTGHWDVSAIEAAFEGRLREDLEPVGFGAHVLEPEASLPISPTTAATVQ